MEKQELRERFRACVRKAFPEESPFTMWQEKGREEYTFPMTQARWEGFQLAAKEFLETNGEEEIPFGMTCRACGHELRDNKHGIDQDDFAYSEHGWFYIGSCKYCKVCKEQAI